MTAAKPAPRKATRKTGPSNVRSDVANRVAQSLIDSRRLFYFYHVARLGSFTSAEAVLDIAQPAMSRQIQQLEADLGARLLERNGRGVSMTQAGSIVYRRAEELLAGMAETHIEVALALRNPMGDISIAAPTYFIRAYMAQVSLAFTTVHPDIRLRVIEASTGHVAELLAAGEVDMAVVLQAPTSSKLEVEELISEHMELAVAKGHPLAKRKSMKRSELHGQPACIAANPHGSRMLVERYCSEGGIKLDIKLEFDSVYLMKHSIATQPVLGFIPPQDCEPGDGIASIPLDPPMVRTMYLAKLRQHHNPMAAPLVADIKAAILARHPEKRRKNVSA